MTQTKEKSTRLALALMSTIHGKLRQLGTHSDLRPSRVIISSKRKTLIINRILSS